MAHLYKTYLFKNKDPIIDELRTIIQDTGITYNDISVVSGVTKQTLHNWFHGATKRPQYATVAAVLAAIGYEHRLVKINKKLKLVHSA